ncbi:MAG: AgmX/PglI C-terminal domain-containing protein [Myxococcales bacterium]|nr:AgmX/PglI C-terminal domain-containing protein [Myxococcales bacterium]
MAKLLLAFIACVLAMTPTASADANPQWIILKVRRVQVAPERADRTPWDAATDRGRTGCHARGAVVSPSEGLPTFLCLGATKQRDRDASAPDLFVEVSFGDTKFRTTVAPDTLNEAFDFPIAVPLEAVPAAGAELRVLDLDDDINGGELVGAVRVKPQQLRDALTGSPLLNLAADRVEKLHVEVRRYDEPKALPPFKFAVNQNPVATASYVRAGELVTIEARGTYGVRGTKEQIGPNGYRAGAANPNNRREFETANHGGALAYIGSPTELHASLLVGPCMYAIAPVPGQLHVGVNDKEIRNNRGAVEFTTKVSLPTVAQWRMGGSLTCAKPDTTSSPLTRELVLARIETAYLASIRLCYKDYLRRNPNARGKVTLSLTVDGTGRTIQGDAQGFSRDVDICINKLMPSWKFQIPRDGEGKPTTSSFAVPLLLQP